VEVIKKTFTADTEEEVDREAKKACQVYSFGATIFMKLKGRTEDQSWESFKSNMLDKALAGGEDGWNKLIAQGEEL
jgi:hypothetical protein